MESDRRNLGNFSYGGPSRMDRVDQFMIPQHSTLLQPRTQPVPTWGASPLDLTTAIAHELQRANSQPAELAWDHPLGGSGSGSGSGSQSSYELDNGWQQPYGPFLSQHNAGGTGRSLIQQNIPRFDEGLGFAVQQLQTRSDYTPDSESLASALRQGQGFYSRSANGLPTRDALPFRHAPQAMNKGQGDSTMRSCSPWIERMMQADVTPTPCPSLCTSTSMSLAQRALGDVSCVASQTVDLQSCHSSDLQRSENSRRSAFNYDPQHDSTVEISADLCTDDEDLETRPIDEKRKKRMLSNRASAQRSRQRRQERLDELEVLTAQLRVENSTLQKKLTAAIQVAKKFEDQNKNLVKKVDRLNKDLEGSKKPRKPIAAFDECASSQQITCASSCEMIGGRMSVDPNIMRDDNINDGASSPSMSVGSLGWPSGTSLTENEREMDGATNGNRGELTSPLRKSFSACRVGRKRSFDQSESEAAGALARSHSTSKGNPMGAGSAEYLTSQPSRPRQPSPPSAFGGGSSTFLEPRPFSYEVCTPLGLDFSLKDDCNVDRWLEFDECFK